jgi:hypothetical protein
MKAMTPDYDYCDDDDNDADARNAGGSGASEWPLNALIAGIGLTGLLICIGPFLLGP